MTASVGESVLPKRVYRNFSIMFPNRIIHVLSVDLDMVDFYIILGMDWLHAYFAYIY